MLMRVLVLLVALAGSTAAVAQEAETAPPLILVIEGRGEFVRAGADDSQPFAPGARLQTDDRITAQADLVVVCPDGDRLSLSAADLDAGSPIPCPEANPSDILLRDVRAVWAALPDADAPDPDTPYIISPRRTAVRTDDLTVRWHALPDTQTYTVTLRQGDAVVWESDVPSAAHLAVVATAATRLNVDLEADTLYTIDVCAVLRDERRVCASDSPTGAGLFVYRPDRALDAVLAGVSDRLGAVSAASRYVRALILSQPRVDLETGETVGDLHEALELLNSILDDLPDSTLARSPEIYRLLRELYRAIGLPAEADAAAERADQLSEATGADQTECPEYSQRLDAGDEVEGEVESDRPLVIYCFQAEAGDDLIFEAEGIDSDLDIRLGVTDLAAETVLAEGINYLDFSPDDDGLYLLVVMVIQVEFGGPDETFRLLFERFDSGSSGSTTNVDDAPDCDEPPLRDIAERPWRLALERDNAILELTCDGDALLEISGEFYELTYTFEDDTLIIDLGDDVEMIFSEITVGDETWDAVLSFSDTPDASFDVTLTLLRPRDEQPTEDSGVDPQTDEPTAPFNPTAEVIITGSAGEPTRQPTEDSGIDPQTDEPTPDVIITGSAGQPTREPTDRPTALSTPAPAQISTPTPSDTPTQTAEPAATFTPSHTPQPTATPPPTATPTVDADEMLTATSVAQAALASTATLTPSHTPQPTATPRPTVTTTRIPAPVSEPTDSLLILGDASVYPFHDSQMQIPNSMRVRLQLFFDTIRVTNTPVGPVVEVPVTQNVPRPAVAAADVTSTPAPARASDQIANVPSRVIASLVCPPDQFSGCGDQPPRDLDIDRTNEWTWTVVPLAEARGRHSLVMEVWAPNADGEKSSRRLWSYTFEVEVLPAANPLADALPLLLVTGVALGGAAAAVMLRRRRAPVAPAAAAPVPLATTAPAGPRVFISYRRSPSWAIALKIRDELTARGAEVFMDVHDLKEGRFEQIIEKEIESRDYFVLILAPTTLDSEWVQKETAHALSHHKTIIPVLVDGFRLYESSMPEDLAVIRDYNAVNLSVEYFEAGIGKLADFVGLA